MTKFLLSVHVLASVIAVGPVTVAASMFPAAARRALAAPGDGSPAAVVRTLHRICRVYALVGVTVPVFGLATAGRMHVLGDAWLIVSIVLTAAAAAVLVGLLLPGQSAVAAAVGPTAAGDAPQPAAPAAPTATATETATATTGRLAMHAGVFNLLWATVTILMIVRPGSTTGA